MRRLFAALFFLLPSLALAQSWPVYENTFINDYANAIDEDAETRIRRSLEVLRDETGVEATVLTIYTRWGFQTSGSIEEFATGLFNTWGIGNAQKNDGILILVVTEDREMRIELGSGYGTGYNREAGDIIETIFIPAFKVDDFTGGIEAGTDAVLTRIARPHAAGEPAPEPAGDALGFSLFSLVFGGIVATFIASIFGRRIKDRLTRCPSCGRRGLDISREVTQAATRSAAGRGQRTVICPHCDFHETSGYTISRIRTSSSSSSSGGSFGGGSSSGGGASGRW
jgi:uncharacterized protein